MDNSSHRNASGTHLAAAHAAGVSAFILADSEDEMSPVQVHARLLQISQKGAVQKMPRDTVNSMVNMAQLITEEVLLEDDYE